MTVEEALEHPYVAAYHHADDEPAANSLSPDYFQFDREPSDIIYTNPLLTLSAVEKEQLSKDDLKKLLYDEVMSFQPVIGTTSG